MKRWMNRRVLGPSPQPGVEVLLPEFFECEAAVVEPVEELDRHGDGLLGS
jgi:hypothetical protein